MRLPSLIYLGLTSLIVQMVGVLGNGPQFTLEVLLHSYNNSGSLGRSCWSNSSQGCSNQFVFCARPTTTSANCSLGRYIFKLNTTATPVIFEEGPIASSEVNNPLMFSSASGLWGGSFVLEVSVTNRDGDGELVEEFFILRNVSSSVQSRETFSGDLNIATLDLSYRVSCTSDYYGPNCERYCVGRNDATGHFTCDPITGEPVCLTGFTDPATNCVTGLTREGVAGLTAGILILVMVIVGVVVGVVCWRRQTYTRYEVDRDNAKKSLDNPNYGVVEMKSNSSVLSESSVGPSPLYTTSLLNTPLTPVTPDNDNPLYFSGALEASDADYDQVTQDMLSTHPSHIDDDIYDLPPDEDGYPLPPSQPPPPPHATSAHEINPYGEYGDKTLKVACEQSESEGQPQELFDNPDYADVSIMPST